MLRSISIFILIVVLSSCGAKEKKEPEMTISQVAVKEAHDIENFDLDIYDFKGIEPLLNKKDDKTYVINFWATWCKPCIKELPYFEKINSEYGSKNVEVILVSLDMPKMWKTHLIPFIKKHDLESRVVILNDPKMNDWIPKVNEDWSGGIPATLIYNSDKRTFYERPFTHEELTKELSAHLKS